MSARENQAPHSRLAAIHFSTSLFLPDKSFSHLVAWIASPELADRFNPCGICTRFEEARGNFGREFQ